MTPISLVFSFPRRYLSHACATSPPPLSLAAFASHSCVALFSVECAPASARSVSDAPCVSLRPTSCQHAHGVRTVAVCFGRDAGGRAVLLSSGADRSLKLWRLDPLRCVRHVTKRPAEVLAACFAGGEGNPEAPGGLPGNVERGRGEGETATGESTTATAWQNAGENKGEDKGTLEGGDVDASSRPADGSEADCSPSAPLPPPTPAASGALPLALPPTMLLGDRAGALWFWEAGKAPKPQSLSIDRKSVV